MILVSGPATLAADRWIAGLDRPDAGVLALVANPGSQAFWLPASLLLEKLGKQRPEPGARPDDAVMLATWLEGYGIANVILHHAEIYDAEVLAGLDVAIASAGARFWCIVDEVLVELARDVLAKATTEWLAWDSFHLHWSEHAFLPPPAADRTVLAILEEIGTYLPPAAIDALPSEDEHWLAQAGITFEWISRGDRPQRYVNGWQPDEVARQVLLRLKEEALTTPSRCGCGDAHVVPARAAAPAWPRPRRHVTTEAARRWKGAPFERGPHPPLAE